MDYCKINEMQVNVTLKGFLVVGVKYLVRSIKQRLMLRNNSGMLTPNEPVVLGHLEPIPATGAVVVRLVLRSPRSPRRLDGTNASFLA